MVTTTANLHSYEDKHYGVWAPFEERENAFEHSHISPIDGRKDDPKLCRFTMYMYGDYRAYKKF